MKLAGPNIINQSDKEKGFTLIELMIVVVIIGIIAAIAYPSYMGHMQNTRRSDGKITLTEIANRLEKFYAMCSAYPPTGDPGLTDNWPAGACDPTTPNVGIEYSTTSPEGHYALSLATTASSFTITATAQGIQADDTVCAAMTLGSDGAKTPPGGVCW